MLSCVGVAVVELFDWDDGGVRVALRGRSLDECVDSALEGGEVGLLVRVGEAGCEQPDFWYSGGVDFWFVFDGVLYRVLNKVGRDVTNLRVNGVDGSMDLRGPWFLVLCLEEVGLEWLRERLLSVGLGRAFGV